MREYRSPLEGIPRERATARHPVWSEIEPRGEAGGFLPSEFDRPEAMDVAFLRLLYRIRLEAGVPLRVISDARDPGRGIGAPRSAHNVDGEEDAVRAIDLQVFNTEERARITLAAILNGVVRWGTYEAGVAEIGGLHLDAEEENPFPRNWTRRI